MTPCPDCGAVYSSPDANCATRFDALLALDHSRAEPWGSRHLLAFSAFVLQHSSRFSREAVERSLLALFSVYVRGAEPRRIANALRRGARPELDWDLPPLPEGGPPTRFEVTIADLGSFPAETYPAQLDAWCTAALNGWRINR